MAKIFTVQRNNTKNMNSNNRAVDLHLCYHLLLSAILYLFYSWFIHFKGMCLGVYVCARARVCIMSSNYIANFVSAVYRTGTRRIRIAKC